VPEICGDCGNRFDSVAHVKACYRVEDTQTSPKETLTPTKNIPIFDPVKKTPAKNIPIFDPVKKTPAKKTPAKKTPAKKTSYRQTSVFDPVEKTPAKRSATKRPASKRSATKRPKKKISSNSDEYTSVSKGHRPKARPTPMATGRYKTCPACGMAVTLDGQCRC